MSLVLYGLPNCDTCKKARNWLARFGIEHGFVDYRTHPVPAATLKAWAQQLGGWEKLVNKSSTTWRNREPDPESDHCGDSGSSPSTPSIALSSRRLVRAVTLSPPASA